MALQAVIARRDLGPYILHTRWLGDGFVDPRCFSPAPHWPVAESGTLG
jgi:hypothetical protein